MRLLLVCFGLAALCAWLAVISALGLDLEMSLEEKQGALDALSMSLEEQQAFIDSQPIIESLKRSGENKRRILAGTGLLLPQVCYILPGMPGYENLED